MGGTPGIPPVPTPSANTPGPHPGPEPGPDGLGISTPDLTQAIHGKEAVFTALSENSAVKALASLATDAKWDRQELTITVPSESIQTACRAVQSAGYNFFEDVTAVDWYPQEPRFQLTYHILSHALKQRIRIVVKLDSASLSIESIIPIWPAANFYEREVFDLFGIHFSGHPRLTRIMMPDNWEGHPLRKDYPVEGYR
ncbi:MAG TPA: NADH-quinone oxidoreductase subunit C [Acidobacteriaceae bacterium]|nr:NADH-quinone oxidoreductase subunit C [Acidobacteriaceae bacterium]